MNVLDITVPLIATNRMDTMMKQLTGLFSQTTSVHALWICAESTRFEFRPSQKRTFLTGLFKELIMLLENHTVVVAPVVFYQCRTSTTDKFLVSNHYNVLIMWLDANGVIQIEKYEPGRSTPTLDTKLKNLLQLEFKKYTFRPVIYYSAVSTGLQRQDERLCGYHIIYWTMYRLKYGLSRARQMVTEGTEGFAKFCRCIAENGIVSRCAS